MADTGILLPRQRVACRRCNAKKIKCNASAEAPCNSCLASNTECILIKSQRGRYVRRQKRNRTSNVSASSQQQQSAEHVRATSPIQSATLASIDHEKSPPQPSSVAPLPDSARLEERERDPDGSFYLHIANQSVNPTNQPITEEVRTLFLGESFSLTYVIHDVLSPFLSNAPRYQKRLHFPIAEGYDPSTARQHNILQRQIDLLRERNLLYQLEPSTSEKLLEVFFRWFNPAFPILDASECMHKCRRNELSLLVLNAILMVTVNICDEDVLALIGLGNRHEARAVFYHQAKALFDSDVEPDKINSVRAVFLLSFWWGGPNDEKDSWYWLGIAIGLAQSLGMHRSTVRSHMSVRTARQWKRIWWSLRVRDALMSGSIGRPQHFSERDCDVEVLEFSDVSDIYTNEDSEQAHYAAQIARLSTIFSDIIVSRYAAQHSDSSDQKIYLEKALDLFRAQIPDDLHYSGIDARTGKGLWSAMLLMAYDFGVILLSRPSRSIDVEAITTPEPWGNHIKALSASNEITRLMEDLLSVSMGRLCQIHTIPALFNSLAMHVYSICMSGSLGRELAENRARTCMLGLRTLQESWPVSGWILKLFSEIMEKLKTKVGIQMSVMGGYNSPPNSTDRTRVLTRMQSNTHSISPTTTVGDAATNIVGLPTDYNGGITTASSNPWPSGSSEYMLAQDHQILPNMFMLNDFSQDPLAEQMMFFDLLNVPDWDSAQNAQYR